MGTESKTPPNLTDEKPQSSASDLIKPMDGDGQDAKVGETNETSVKSVFMNSEPMREEQVQNAVKFLSHPKVSGSPVIYRRSFLEKKGLTKEEIDEAFRRVPDPPPTVTSVQATTTNQDGQLKSTNMQPQTTTQTPQPAAAAPTGVISTLATVTQSQFHWSHAFLAVGLLSASGAGTALLFKNVVVPRLKSWIRKVASEEADDPVKKISSQPSLAEEAAAAAKAAAAAAADVAKASQEMLNSKKEEKRYFEAFMSALGAQVEEMKSMSNAIQKLESTKEAVLSSNKQIEEYVQSASRNGPSDTPWRAPIVDGKDPSVSLTSSKQAKANGVANIDMGSVRPSSAPASIEPSVAPHPKSYMEIMDMVRRGEKPPGIKDINDLPPNPNQLPSNPRVAPRVKPWEVGQAQNSSSYGLQSQATQDNGSVSQLNGDNSVPWWQQKNGRLTEIESEDEMRMTSYGAVANERPVQRPWVPPQPPPVAMPEAAAAIRQPKPLIQKEELGDEQLVAHPSDEIDELQRITKLSESGGGLEMNNGTSVNEIEELENGYEGN